MAADLPPSGRNGGTGTFDLSKHREMAPLVVEEGNEKDDNFQTGLLLLVISRGLSIGLIQRPLVADHTQGLLWWSCPCSSHCWSYSGLLWWSYDSHTHGLLFAVDISRGFSLLVISKGVSLLIIII